MPALRVMKLILLVKLHSRLTWAEDLLVEVCAPFLITSACLSWLALNTSRSFKLSAACTQQPP